uniref:Uncharacterized protein n=1 Tax=Chenopodium quinoa TaxID=63459 RepID=A0A803N5F0_CHEQI
METSPAEPSILRVRRIVAYADITDNDFDSDFQNLRSYFSFNCTRYDTPAKGVGNFLRRIIGSRGFGLLRVLDLEGVYKPILPTTLKLLAESYCGQKMQCPENGFVNLRVLKLWMLNNLEEWVVELGGMPNIKELEIRSCQQLKELPISF